MAQYQKHTKSTFTERLRNSLNALSLNHGVTWAEIGRRTGINYRILIRFANENVGMCYENGMTLKRYIMDKEREIAESLVEKDSTPEDPLFI